VRWARRGVWENLFRELAGGGTPHVKAHRSAAGGKRMARPVGKWFSQVAQTVCTNVSGLSAMPLAKMEIRAFRSS